MLEIMAWDFTSLDIKEKILTFFKGENSCGFRLLGHPVYVTVSSVNNHNTSIIYFIEINISQLSVYLHMTTGHSSY